MGKKALAIAGVFTLFLLTGCSSAPAVSYHSINRSYVNGEKNEDALMENLKGKKVFNLPSGMVFLHNSEESKKGENTPESSPLEQVKLTVLPSESDANWFQIEEHNNWLEETKLKITYYDDSKIVKEVGSEFVDKTVQRVTEVAGVIGAILPFVLLNEPSCDNTSLTLPVSLELKLVEDLTELPRNKCWKYTINPQKDFPANAVKSEDYFTTGNVSTFPISACETFIIHIQAAEDKNIKIDFKIRGPNPKFVEAIAFPVKGKISMNTLCTANVTSETDTNPSAAKKLEEVIKLAKTVYDQYKKKDSGSSDRGSK